MEAGVEGDRSEPESVERRLERVYREQGVRIWRAVLLSSGSREIADDAVAEAFAQALRRGDELRDPAAWVWRVAFRVAAGELKERGRVETFADEPAAGLPDPFLDLWRAIARASAEAASVGRARGLRRVVAPRDREGARLVRLGRGRARSPGSEATARPAGGRR